MSRIVTVIALLLVCFAAPAAAQVSSPPPYESPMRDQCIAEMAKDAVIRANCAQQYSDEFHDQDARQATKNKRHVVYAYAAIFAILAFFVVSMWLRQRKLSAEIDRLEAELKKAVSE